jgi:hypothetical protein
MTERMAKSLVVSISALVEKAEGKLGTLTFCIIPIKRHLLPIMLIGAITPYKFRFIAASLP